MLQLSKIIKTDLYFQSYISPKLGHFLGQFFRGAACIESKIDINQLLFLGPLISKTTKALIVINLFRTTGHPKKTATCLTDHNLAFKAPKLLSDGSF